jgi:4-hydroxythreonine-4-phosphate dehydrogenase
LANNKHRICFTSGDCNGIGLEVFLKSVASGAFLESENTLICNSAVLEDYAEHYSMELSQEGDTITCGQGQFKLEDCVTSPELEFGAISKDAGLHAGESIDKAVVGCLEGSYDAMITLPIQKESVYLAGWTYPGHTELIAARCGVRHPLMIMEHEGLRVTLLTIHVPLRQVPAHISVYRINETVSAFARCLKKDFGVVEPKIALLGLNPHSGENGNIGTEEVDIYSEALLDLRGQGHTDGFSIDGPLPADGLFAHGAYKEYDGIVASYHDQGLIPLKLLAAGGGVNYTGGLQIVRTSPDHGTAMDIAGKSKANPKSLQDAYKLAIEIADNRARSI